MDNYLSTGLTTLNLQLSNDTRKGIRKGSCVFMVGDSSAGKSFLSSTLAANAVIDEDFDGYQIICDDTENGHMFDMETLFGPRVAGRVTSPDNGNSEFVEEFYASLNHHLDKGPCIYILDSQDGLTSKGESGKFDELVKALEKAPDAKAALKKLGGSYGDGKAKTHSQHLRQAVSRVEQTGSILVIVGQTRDDIQGYAQDGLVWSGGKALKFYSHMMLHLVHKDKIEKTYQGNARQIGINSEVRVIKNRQTGKRTRVRLPIYYSHGLDDVQAAVEWMIGEKQFSKGTMVDTKDELLGKSTMDKLCRDISFDEAKYDRLLELIQQRWDEVETAVAVTRRNKYA